MATITRYPFLRHLRAAPTAHVVQMSGGRVRRTGPGLAFWFRPLDAVLSEVPVDDRELPLVARARTSDLQEVTVQVTVSFRVADPETAAQRLDFGIDPATGRWTAAPLEHVAQLLGELATGHVTDALAGLTLRAAVSAGTGALSAQVTAALRTDARVAATGLDVLAVRVRSVRADADLECALQTPAREAAQADADRSTFERRALAVERERAIAENELATRIELAVREERLVAQEGANARARAEEAAAARLVEARAAAERDTVLAQAAAEATRLRGEADGAAEAARLAANVTVPVEVLRALALRDLAAHLPSVGQLTVTPDLLTGALAGLTARGGE
ncbi:SPFH domain-containing protein [Aquipuribacter sp. SD81]|uniref:SPFH domain-containing protein n=1 Tax=Aquipuribacter sp. SD81 TaxID=3127703 RepID=UPI0030192057